MNKEIVNRIIARLGENERRVMALSTVQLPMRMLDGVKGIVVETHMKVPSSTFKSLMARNLAAAKPDKASRIMPLTSLGVQVNEALSD